MRMKKKEEKTEEKDPIWFKEVKCQVCDAVHKAPRVKPSALKVKSIEADFHKVYEKINPLLYAVTVCNQCNYAARNEDYDKVTLEYHKEIIDLAMAIKNSKKNVTFKNERAITYEEAVRKHLLAISFYKHFKPENPNTISGLYMHLVWMSREQKNSEKEKEYMQHALEYYIKTYEKGVHIPEKIGIPGITYLIGELYRKLGDRKEAVNWFARTCQSDEIDAYPNIRNLAKDAWELITEEKKKELKDNNET